MKLTGHACTEAMSGAEEARQRERAEGSAGGVRVERRVRRCRGAYQKCELITTSGNHARLCY
jgi:hypothetical protein